jgi:hypothetical protein
VKWRIFKARRPESPAAVRLAREGTGPQRQRRGRRVALIRERGRSPAPAVAGRPDARLKAARPASTTSGQRQLDRAVDSPAERARREVYWEEPGGSCVAVAWLADRPRPLERCEPPARLWSGPVGCEATVRPADGERQRPAPRGRGRLRMSGRAGPPSSAAARPSAEDVLPRPISRACVVGAPPAWQQRLGSRGRRGTLERWVGSRRRPSRRQLRRWPPARASSPYRLPPLACRSGLPLVGRAAALSGVRRS